MQAHTDLTKTADEASERPAAVGHSWVGELLLRLLGAALQIVATLAIVSALSPDDAGVFFRGFVIALGLGTLLRGKYELHMAQLIIGRRAATTGIPDGVLLMQLARRMLLRSSLLCGVLLVVTADLDIQAPQLQTVLQTYFPFVLALPCVSVSSFFGEALRAANRTLGIVVAAYAVNVSLLLAVMIAPPDASLAFYSWAFFLGSLVAAAVALVLAGQALPATRAERLQPIAREALQAVDSREFIGLARGVLWWGPLCVLAVWAPPLQMAQYAVAARTALIVDYFLPALNLTGCRETLTATHQRPCASRRLFLGQLARALGYATVLVLPLLLLAPETLRIYGTPYDDKFVVVVYAVLLGVQWANGVGRPAVRHAVVAWDARRISIAVGSGAVAVVLICALAVGSYGALAAAAASLIGALIVNTRAISLTLDDWQADPTQTGSPPPKGGV